ncbi:MAG: phage tail sheath family protein, partial [Leptolyngbya sp. RL_3_1]|nr:phage tail sheath family protein [Leptolyngbya sp. RL_3_1]
HAGADSQGRSVFRLGNGTDGSDPSAERYREALDALDAIDGISIIAAPGLEYLSSSSGHSHRTGRHAERRGAYRIAVLDGPQAQTVGQIRNIRATMDSDHAALYHPWIVVQNPDARPGDRSRPLEIPVPPSGHVCGIYARNDIEKSVAKAPAAISNPNNDTRGRYRVNSPNAIAPQFHQR